MSPARRLRTRILAGKLLHTAAALSLAVALVACRDDDSSVSDASGRATDVGAEGEAPTTEGSAPPIEPTQHPTTICDVAATVVQEDVVVEWLNLLPGEYVRGSECEDLNPADNEGTVSDFHLAIEHPDNPAPDPGTTTGISLQLTDRVIGFEVISEQEGSAGDPPWFSRERVAAMFDAAMFDFVDSQGRELPALGREGWIEVHVGDFVLKFGYLSEHPDFERAVEPVVVNGQVNPFYQDVLSELVKHNTVKLDCNVVVWGCASRWMGQA